jgi:hypothetical protein
MTGLGGANPVMSQTNLRPDLADLLLPLRNLDDRHRHAAQSYTTALGTHGGMQMAALELTVQEMNPEPQEVTTESEHAWMNDVFMRVAGGWHVVEKAAAGQQLSSSEQQTLGSVLDRVKPAARHVYEDVRLKLALAPEPAAPPLDYGQRLVQWFKSPGYQALGWPCVAGVVQQAATGESAGLAMFIAGGTIGLLVPPAVTPEAVFSYTRASIFFIVLASVAVLVALILGGLLVALGVFAVAALSFIAGQRSPR